MVQQFTIFETLTNNRELEDQFHSFFYRYGLTSLFSNEHRAGNISVTYLDIRSVINPTGAYHRDLVVLADLLATATDNKMYEEAVFKIIYEARTFQKMMAIVRKIIKVDQEALIHDLEFNLWNIVYYTKSLF